MKKLDLNYERFTIWFIFTVGPDEHFDNWGENGDNPWSKQMKKELYPRIITNQQFKKELSANGQKYTAKTGKNIRICAAFEDNKIKTWAEIVIKVNEDDDIIYIIDFDFTDLDKEFVISSDYL